MFRSRSWFGGGWGRPKNPHSLEHLKYLYNVLARNQTVSEHNRGLLVESLRSIAEILIWGDQNDSSVFDFFLEKNMLSFFLRIMRQRSGGSSYVCVQLLQTLNILFENIRNETSLYYLLSNNHVNSIIVHKFDFSDEEVMAYYISFLKTLSFKLNGHTIHFFYNEHTNDFPLYTEAIKFFNHRESMVRIAVRTLTLNVYRVEDASMLKFIRDRTAAPYFSNLVWFIGKHILELDSCVRNDADHQSQQKLDDLVAEHLDHLHYLNDILCLNISDLNQVLTEHLLHKLLIPLYIYSLTSNNTHKIKHLGKKINTNSEQIQHLETITRNLAAILNHKGIDLGTTENCPSTRVEEAEDEQKPRVSCVVALFLLSQVFLIITHSPLVHALAWIILHSNDSVFDEGATNILENYLNTKKVGIKLEFSKPSESLEKALAVSTSNTQRYDAVVTDAIDGLQTLSGIPIGNYADAEHFNDQSSCDMDPDLVSNSFPSTSHVSESSSTRNNSCEDLLSGNIDSASKQTYLETYMTKVSEEIINNGLPNVPDSPVRDSGIESNTSDSVQESNLNITDEEKEKIALSSANTPIVENKNFDGSKRSNMQIMETKPFLETILKSLDCSENDYIALFALCLLYALINNKGINKELLSVILEPIVKCEKSSTDNCPNENSTTRIMNTTPMYSETLVDKLINIIHLSCQPTCRVRLVSLELSLKLLSQAAGGIVITEDKSENAVYSAVERRARAVEEARQRAGDLVRNFYKTDGIFLDMFEDEYCEMCKRPLNVEWLCMDSAILLPPTGTPMTGIAFTKRLPCGEVERARRAIRAYFLIRELSLNLNGETDTQLPLTNPLDYKQIGNVLDLNNSDLIACTIVLKDGQKSRRFMVIESIQIILVEPDQRLGWGMAKLVGNLQDLEVTGDKDDSRCLHLTIYKPPSTTGVSGRAPLLQAKFVFDDHIRCMAAKQRLTKGRTRARQKKMQQIARLLDVTGVPTAPTVNRTSREHRPLFTTGARVPGFAAALRRDSMPGVLPRSRHKEIDRSNDSSGGNSGNVTPPVPGYEREAIGSYFSNNVHKGYTESAARISISHESRDHRRGSGTSGGGYRRPSPAAGVLRDIQSSQKQRERTNSRDSRGNRSREGSPRMPRPRSEEIPLEPLSTAPDKPSPSVSHGQIVQGRPHTQKILGNEPDLLKTCTTVESSISSEKPNLVAQMSEETSFISHSSNNIAKDTKQRKKPFIETI